MKKALSLFALVIVLLFSIIGCASPKNNNITNSLPSTNKNNDEQISSTPKITQNAKLSKQDAKRIALENAGVNESDIFDYENELDLKKGILTYEISFDTKDFEYDYHISATDGAIIKFEKEPNDIY